MKALSAYKTLWLIFFCAMWMNTIAQQGSYSWKDSVELESTIAYRIPTPGGFERISVPSNSFADWLRHLPLRPEGTPVMLYNGARKGNQGAHYAVIDIEPGTRDLQQCADAVMRLRAEYLFSCGDYEAIHFNFTSGDAARYERWRAGYRPRVSGNSVSWQQTARADGSYAGFRKYMESVFMYAGTWSLSKEMKQVSSVDQLMPGDVFIRGGFPGHAVIVVDVAVDAATGEKRFLLAQSYMPAQDIHVLNHPTHPEDPWYEIPAGELHTPEWIFEPGSLRRF